MNNIIANNTMFSGLKASVAGAFVAVIAATAVFAVAPAQTRAFDPAQLIDPFCLFACDDSQPQPTTVNYTNSNNVNSNVNSPNSTVVSGGVTTVNNPSTTPVIVTVPTPVYNYSYPSTNYTYSSLSVSCYSMPTSASVGTTISWRSNPTGGNGSYYVTWSGSEGLSGYGTTISKSYAYTGSKTATVTVTSGGQSISQNCSNSVDVYDYNNGYSYTPTYNYGYNYGYNNYYTPLYVTCTANTSFAPVGTTVTWNSSVTGGNGNYSYSWSGTDAIHGYNSTLNVNYNTPGVKYGRLTVTSNGQSVYRDCTNSVSVGIPNQGYNYNSNNYNSNVGDSGLEIACYADAVTVRPGTPVTWAVEVTGGYGDYRYSWTGTEGLSGSQRSAVIAYDTVGKKKATVTVTSGGMTESKLCGNAVTVSSGTVVKKPAAKPVVTVKPSSHEDNSGITAASYFSLRSVPWGWVAILVILVLFSMVMYLLFNRNQIK